MSPLMESYLAGILTCLPILLSLYAPTIRITSYNVCYTKLLRDFLKRNDELTEDYINKLTPEQQEIAKSINRRTEFRVLSTDYQEEYKPENLK